MSFSHASLVLSRREMESPLREARRNKCLQILLRIFRSWVPGMPTINYIFEWRQCLSTLTAHWNHRGKLKNCQCLNPSPRGSYIWAGVRLDIGIFQDPQVILICQSWESLGLGIMFLKIPSNLMISYLDEHTLSSHFFHALDFTSIGEKMSADWRWWWGIEEINFVRKSKCRLKSDLCWKHKEGFWKVRCKIKKWVTPKRSSKAKKKMNSNINILPRPDPISTIFSPPFQTVPFISMFLMQERTSCAKIP